MRTIIVSLVTAGLLLAVIFQSSKGNRAEMIIFAAQAMAQTSPTPAKNQTKKQQEVPAAPVKIRPDYDEPTFARRLNSALGSPDIDCDGAKNSEDNCLFTYNPNQKDSNKNGIGDVCEPDPRAPSIIFLACDMDRDGVSNNKDNCPGVCNPDQKLIDVNKNGVNDICDSEMPDSVSTVRMCARPRQIKLPKTLRQAKLPWAEEIGKPAANTK